MASWALPRVAFLAHVRVDDPDPSAHAIGRPEPRLDPPTRLDDRCPERPPDRKVRDDRGRERAPAAVQLLAKPPPAELVESSVEEDIDDAPLEVAPFDEDRVRAPG